MKTYCSGMNTEGTPREKPKVVNLVARSYQVPRFIPTIAIIALICLGYFPPAFFGIIGPLLFEPERLNWRTMGLVISLGLLLAPVFVYLISATWVRVILNEIGVHKRMFFAWRRVRWEEIIEVGVRRSHFQIRPRNGRLLCLFRGLRSQDVTLSDDFPKYMARFAPGAAMRRLDAQGSPGKELFKRRLSHMPVFISSPLRPWQFAAYVLWGIVVAAGLLVVLVRFGVDWLSFLRPTVTMLGLVALVFSVGLIGVVKIKLYRALRRVHRDLCWTCGYDLRGATNAEGRCPECGGDRRLQALYDKWVPPETLTIQSESQG